MSFELTRKIHSLILSHDDNVRWTRRAVNEITEQREALRDIAEALGRFVDDSGEGRLFWYTFAGAPLNELLGIYLKSKIGDQLVSWDDFCVSLPGTCDAKQIIQAARELLDSDDIIGLIPASEEVIDQLKFSECLPQELAHRAVLGRLDLGGLSVEKLMGG